MRKRGRGALMPTQRSGVVPAGLNSRLELFPSPAGWDFLGIRAGGASRGGPAAWGGGSGGSAAAPRFFHAISTRFPRGSSSPCFPERPSNPSAPNYPSRQLNQQLLPREPLLPQERPQELFSFSARFRVRGWMSLDVPGEGWQQHRGHPGGGSASLGVPGARSPFVPSPKSPPGPPRSAFPEKSVSNPRSRLPGSSELFLTPM